MPPFVPGLTLHRGRYGKLGLDSFAALAAFSRSRCMPEAALSHQFVCAFNPPPLPAELAGSVVAIGNFDGVHRGHRAVIGRAQALARTLGRPCAVLTFEPHPSDFFAGAPVIFRLTPLDAKALALQRLGVDGMIVLPFDAGLAALGAEEFVTEVLVGRLGVDAVVAGYDFHFGKSRAGTPGFLQAAGDRHGFGVEIVGRISQDGSGSLDAVSSTATREALQHGDIAAATQLLGHEYFVTGIVVHGQKLGRTLGFPTANLALDPSCKLATGIYAVHVRIGSQVHGGVASYGHRPTFDNGAALLEVFLFDFAADIYGTRIEVAFAARLRGEEKFAGADALVVQMHKDAALARQLLNPGNALQC